MPITVHIHDRLRLHMIVFEGDVRFAELRHLAILHGLRPDFAKADAVHIVATTANLSAITRDEIDELRAYYRARESSLDLIVLRRVAWICPDERARAVIEYWLAGRHSLDGQKTEVRLGARLSDADGLFDREELEAVAGKSGFTQVARFEGDAIA